MNAETVFQSECAPWQPKDLVCPKCQKGLRTNPYRLLCPDCGACWPVIDQIPSFIEDFPYWGEIPLEAMHQVNRDAANGNWRAALLDSPNPAVRQASEMILNLQRANWQWLLDLPPDARALDVGAGMGTTSHALALRCREVVALEPVWERIRFMQQRFHQERLSNIGIVRSSIWNLPFGQGSFDLAVMNGVLEWVPDGLTGNPAELQLQGLKRIERLLRPKGYLYLGIENRFTVGYFIGHPDPHCGLPFTTILPRFLAHLYARRRGNPRGYRNYLYSASGYRKLLHKAGFEQVQIYIAMPSYNHPRFLIPLKGNVFSYYSRQFNGGQAKSAWKLAYKALLACGLLKHLQYSYVILARKQGSAQ